MAALNCLVFILLLGLGHATLEKLYVATVLGDPFIVESASDSDKGHWGYKGILIDLLVYIIENAKLFNKDVTPKFTVLKDYGKKNEDGSWTGIIQEVANTTRRSVGIADLTITADRLDAVQFSVPYLTTGLTAVDKGLDFMINTENLPKILKMARDDKIAIGCRKDDLTEFMFRTSNVQIFKDLYAEMKKHEENFVKTDEEGFAKIRNSPADKPYVFFGEKATLDEHALMKPCDVNVTLCETLSTLEYALVFHKDSNPDYVNGFNKAIAEYLASGKMQESKQKWSKNECNGA